MVRSEGGGRSCHCGGKSDTGSTGPSSLGRGQRSCLAAGVCQDGRAEVGFGASWARTLVTNYGKRKLYILVLWTVTVGNLFKSFFKAIIFWL